MVQLRLRDLLGLFSTMGRPRNGSANSLIKSWKPIYDQMVLMYVAGGTYEKIAEEVEYSVTRVSVVLKSELGIARIREIMTRLNDRVIASVGDRFIRLTQQAANNLEVTINADIPIQALKAKIHQDNVSFKLLELVGFGKHGDNKPRTEQPLLSKDGEDKLIKAIARADEAKLVAVDLIENAEFEVVDV